MLRGVKAPYQAPRSQASRRRGSVPALPAVAFCLGLVLLLATVFGTVLPAAEDAFVAGALRGAPRELGTAIDAYKPTAMDRGTPQYEEYMRKKRQVREAAWNMQDKDINSAVGSSYAESMSAAIESRPSEFETQFKTPSPSAASSGGNPFQFLIDIFQGTTTTTTTTQPPNPIEAFFKSLR